MWRFWQHLVVRMQIATSIHPTFRSTAVADTRLKCRHVSASLLKVSCVIITSPKECIFLFHNLPQGIQNNQIRSN